MFKCRQAKSKTFDIWSCQNCDKICQKYVDEFWGHYDKWLPRFIAHVNKFPDKYKLEIITMAEKVTQVKQIAAINKQGNIIKVYTEKELKELTPDKMPELAGLTLRELGPNEYKLVMTLTKVPSSVSIPTWTQTQEKKAK